MAGPFHHDLRRDSAGESKADEGMAAGVSADEFVFRLGDFFTLSGTIGHTGDGDIELTKLAEILQIIIHLLIGDDREEVDFDEVYSDIVRNRTQMGYYSY